MARATSVNPVKMPVTFKEFSKEPVKALMFICLVAVGYLYIDGKVSNTTQIKSQNKKIEVLEAKIDALTSQLRKSDSTASALASKITVLQELGKIK
jgi:hypothetical protein